jgi:excisionase family DNA binding protein
LSKLSAPDVQRFVLEVAFVSLLVAFIANKVTMIFGGSSMEAAAHTMEDLIRRMTPVAAPPEQQAQVVALSKALEGMAHQPRKRAPRCQLVGPKGETIALPESVFYVLERVAEVMARGDSITVVPVGREVTTQQAADLLNVSRQYLVRLLDEGRIPFRKTGKHRRLRIEDVLSFKETRDKDRRAGLRELSRMTEDFGGYDSELK